MQSSGKPIKRLKKAQNATPPGSMIQFTSIAAQHSLPATADPNAIGKPLTARDKLVTSPFFLLSSKSLPALASPTSPPSALTPLSTTTSTPTSQASTVSTASSSTESKSPSRKMSTQWDALELKDFTDSGDCPDLCSTADFDCNALTPHDFPQTLAVPVLERTTSLGLSSYLPETKTPAVKSPFEEPTQFLDAIEPTADQPIDVFMSACDKSLLLTACEIDNLLDILIPRGLIKHVNYLCAKAHGQLSPDSLKRHVKTAIQYDQSKILERLSFEGAIYHACASSEEYRQLMRSVKDKPLCKEFLKKLDKAFRISSPEALLNFQKQYPCAIFWKNSAGLTLMHQAVINQLHSPDQSLLIQACMPDDNQRLVGINPVEEIDVKFGFTPLLMAASIGLAGAIRNLLLYAKDHRPDFNTQWIDRDNLKRDIFYLALAENQICSGLLPKHETEVLQILQLAAKHFSGERDRAPELLMMASKNGFYKVVIFLISQGYQFDVPVNGITPLRCTDNVDIKTLLSNINGLINAVGMLDLDTFEEKFRTLFKIFDQDIFFITSHRVQNKNLSDLLIETLGINPSELASNTPAKFAHPTVQSFYDAMKQVIHKKRIASTATNRNDTGNRFFDGSKVSASDIPTQKPVTSSEQRCRISRSITRD